MKVCAIFIALLVPGFSSAVIPTNESALPGHAAHDVCNGDDCATEFVQVRSSSKATSDLEAVDKCGDYEYVDIDAWKISGRSCRRWADAGNARFKWADSKTRITDAYGPDIVLRDGKWYKKLQTWDCEYVDIDAWIISGRSCRQWADAGNARFKWADNKTRITDAYGPDIVLQDGKWYKKLQTSYTVTEGKHCGGQSIKAWANGGSSSYGKNINDLSGCKSECSAHEDCAGFVLRLSDKRCAFWKKAPLRKYSYRGHDCYEKQ